MPSTSRKMSSAPSVDSRATRANRACNDTVLFELHERIDVDVGEQLLGGQRMAELKADAHSNAVWSGIRDTINIARHAPNGAVLVRYYLEDGQVCGRMKAAVLSPGSGATPYVRMKKEARAHLAARFYWDVDMANCHPLFLKQAMVKHRIECPLLEKYIAEREMCIKEVMDACGVDRNAAKELFLRLMFFGGVNGWLLDHPDVQPSSVPAWVPDFKEELHRNADTLLTCDEFASFKKYAADRALLHDTPGWTRGNRLASVMALYLQTVERECVCSLVRAINEDARAVGGIIYDGCLVERVEGETELAPSLLTGWASYVKDETGHDVVLAVKPLAGDPSWLVPYAEPGASAEVDAMWCDKWMQGDVSLSYAEMKQKWECRSFKVVGSGNYVREEASGRRRVMSEHQLHESYRHLSYDEVISSRGGVVRLTPKPFISRWVSDKTIRQFSEMVLAPPPKTAPSDAYNIWTPTAVERFKPVRAVDTGSDGVRFLVEFVHILCCRKASLSNYLLDWVAQIFQQPAVKTGIAVLLKGEEGAGKNRFTDLIRELLGSDKVLQTANPSNVLYGRFTNLREGKLLVVVNEANGSDHFSAQDVMKDMITCDEFVSESKGQNAYPMSCFARFIFTSNHDNPLKVQADSRRYWVVEASSELRRNTSYFQELSRHIDDPHTRYEFYKFLMARDISCRDWINDRPVTEGQREMALLNMPFEHQFVKHMVLSAPRDSVRLVRHLDTIHSEFLGWLALKHITARHDTSALKFAHKLLKLVWNPANHTGFKGLEKSRDVKGVLYRLDVPTLRAEMRAKGWLAADEV